MVNSVNSEINILKFKKKSTKVKKMDDIDIKYIYILVKFVSVESKISLHNAIAKIIQCNKLAYDGYENKRQCKELVYHGIIIKADTGILSLNDYIYKKTQI